MGFETKQIYQKQKQNKKKKPPKTEKQKNKKTHLPVSLYVVQGLGFNLKCMGFIQEDHRFGF